jgi:hypothetical protein
MGRWVKLRLRRELRRRVVREMQAAKAACAFLACAVLVLVLVPLGLSAYRAGAFWCGKINDDHRGREDQRARVRALFVTGHNLISKPAVVGDGAVVG